MDRINDLNPNVLFFNNVKTHVYGENIYKYLLQLFGEWRLANMLIYKLQRALSTMPKVVVAF